MISFSGLRTLNPLFFGATKEERRNKRKQQIVALGVPEDKIDINLIRKTHDSEKMNKTYQTVAQKDQNAQTSLFAIIKKVYLTSNSAKQRATQELEKADSPIRATKPDIDLSVSLSLYDMTDMVQQLPVGSPIYQVPIWGGSNSKSVFVVATNKHSEVAGLKALAQKVLGQPMDDDNATVYNNSSNNSSNATF
jgi:hypothetical protein